MVEKYKDQLPFTPSELFKAASMLAHKGVIQGGGSSYYDEFVGSYEESGEKHQISIELHTTPGHDDIRIYGEGIKGYIHNYLGSSRSNQPYSIYGEIPANLLETLSKLAPDKEAMRKLEEEYRESMQYYVRQRHEALEKLRLPRTPFWEAEKIPDSMSPRDAKFHVETGRGRLLPFWIRNKFR